MLQTLKHACGTPMNLAHWYSIGLLHEAIHLIQLMLPLQQDKRIFTCRFDTDQLTCFDKPFAKSGSRSPLMWGERAVPRAFVKFARHSMASRQQLTLGLVYAKRRKQNTSSASKPWRYQKCRGTKEFLRYVPMGSSRRLLTVHIAYGTYPDTPANNREAQLLANTSQDTIPPPPEELDPENSFRVSRVRVNKFFKFYSPCAARSRNILSIWGTCWRTLGVIYTN